MHIFTYGSLMFAPVWNRVVRGHYKQLSGTLPGYLRRAVRDASYPVVLRAPSDNEVHGIVYCNIEEADLQRLDHFEGDYYRRCRETVRLDDGRTVVAGVYVLRDRYLHIAADRDWNRQWFQREGINQFLRDYRGFTADKSER